MNVIYLDALPSPSALSETLGYVPETLLVIYDKALRKQKPFVKWLEKMPAMYPVSAGEKLKDLDQFAKHVRRIFSIVGAHSPRGSTCVLAVGGGSVGDFGGFLASIWKRGVDVIHVPSTLLAALDSSHGGKTALNIGGVKNQIGTIYPARAVFVVGELLRGLSNKQVQSAAGELCKIALLTSRDFCIDLTLSSKQGFDWIWEFLPKSIEAKYYWVQKDPFETLGMRQFLNFGHTLGHCLEAFYKVPHGEAIGYGTRFALNWSYHRGYLKPESLEQAVQMVEKRCGLVSPEQFLHKRPSLSRKRLRQFITSDKKVIDRDHISFVFLEELGKPILKTVTIDSLLTEAQRQEWVPK